MNRENSSHMIRVLVGGYLMYLSYQMIESLRAGEVEDKVLIIVATVAFVISGAVILFYGIRGMIRQGKISVKEEADANFNEDLKDQD